MKQGLVGLVAGLLLAMAGPARAQDVREVSRSAPIVETDGSDGTQYQGTYEVVTPLPPRQEFLDASSAATFEFPYIKGHLRAIDTDNISAIDTTFDALPAIFDAAEHIPPVVPGC